MAYVDGDAGDVAASLGLKPVSSGANVTLLEAYDAGVFYASQEIKGARVVSPVQLYLDLMSFRGRGEEAAAAVLEKTIGAEW
jgi:Transcriptional regulator, AbiEi antitoxin, Type IV TA system